MKSRIYLVLLISMLFASCEKVIKVDLNSASPQYVIEADLYEGANPFSVHITRTTDYFGTQPQAQVNDAVVTLIEPNGNTINIPFTANGWYTLPEYTATAGSTYGLKVQAGGKEFTASSTVPGTVPIDSLTYEYDDNGFGDASYEVAAHFTDPESQHNYYRMLVSINNELRNEPGDLYLFNDKFNNGNAVIMDYGREIEANDTVDIELRAMDKNVFDFYTSLNDILNNQNGPAPANPNTNIKGGAMGYFGAFSSSKKRTIIIE